MFVGSFIGKALQREILTKRFIPLAALNFCEVYSFQQFDTKKFLQMISSNYKREFLTRFTAFLERIVSQSVCLFQTINAEFFQKVDSSNFEQGSQVPWPYSST